MPFPGYGNNVEEGRKIQSTGYAARVFLKCAELMTASIVIRDIMINQPAFDFEGPAVFFSF